MQLDEIKELIALMRKNKIKEIDLKREGMEVRVVAHDLHRPSKGETIPAHMVLPALAQPLQAPAAPAPLPEPPSPALDKTSDAEAPAEPDAGGVEIKAPMVGTFYQAPSPESPPYVEEGTVVDQDTVVCILEAMKLMNEIKADMRGKILRVLVEDGQPIEFGQPLYLVEPF